MKKEVRTVVFDAKLDLEAYRFEGIVQSFPCHFHDSYVLGLIEKGERIMTCKNRNYTIRAGDLLLLNPGDSHGCVQSDDGLFDYISLNIKKEVMQKLAEDITGIKQLPEFITCTVTDPDLAFCLRKVHKLIMAGTDDLEKEESLLLLISLVMNCCTEPAKHYSQISRKEVNDACTFIENHYDTPIHLDQICQAAGLSKSALLRSFTRIKGITPYRYLENIRIDRARRLLEQGVSSAEAALMTGFSDQSHFTAYFTRFIGLGPGAYRDMFKERDDLHNEK